MFFFFFARKCEYSLEAPGKGVSNEYQHAMEVKYEKYQYFFIGKSTSSIGLEVYSDENLQDIL